MDFLNDPVMALFGRPDFIGGIDNEALDFGQLESFIHVTNGTAPVGAGSPSVTVGTPSHLPESPPDSGSEPPYSPADLHGLTLTGTPGTHAQITELHHHTPPNPSVTDLQTDISNLADISQTSIELGTVVPEMHVTHHIIPNPNVLYMRTDSDQQTSQSTSLPTTNGIIHKTDEILINPSSGPTQDQQIILQQGATLLDIGTHANQVGGYRSELTSSPNLLSLGPQQINTEELTRLIPLPDVYHHSGTNLTVVNSRKRKLSQPDLCIQSPIVKPEPAALSPMCPLSIEPPSPIGGGGSGSQADNGAAEASTQNSDSGDTCPLQCIRFSPFQQQNWHVLCDQSLQELPIPHYRVDADKGFNFSNSDDAFVCQKKNHFQITCHAQLQGAAIFVQTTSGLEKIKSFHLHFYGVKLEAPTQTIRVEQSQSDRSKKPFHPVLIDLQNRQVSKVTVGRLHFSETTSNNMRKKGRPNPEQRYFQLVVGLHAHTHSGHFPVISHGSERIIVRASNPGQFESDVELCWQRGVTQDSIYHAGRVGINTDRPDESLVVHGNLKVSGHIVQPSDSRAKEEISELDTAKQLQNVQKIRVVKYRYEPAFAIHSGLATMDDKKEIIDTGVIAQEIREVLPDAVKEAGSILLPNGQVIDNFLVVNKDRIFMENIGAVKELCKVTGSLETRIEQLERINSRLVRIQKIDRNIDCVHLNCKQKGYEEPEACSNKVIQIIIVVLVVIMAVCLAAISTLYFVEHHKQNERYLSRYEISRLASSGFGTINGLENNWRKSHLDYPFMSRTTIPTITSHAMTYEETKQLKKSKSTKQSVDTDLNWTQRDSTFLLPDVDSNLIDTGQMTKNGSKPQPEQILTKSRNAESDVDLQNLLNTSDSEDQPIIETEYQRERTIEIPIGTPQHCQLTSQEINSIVCQSVCCNKEANIIPEEIPSGDVNAEDVSNNITKNPSTPKPNSIKGLHDDAPIEVKELLNQQHIDNLVTGEPKHSVDAGETQTGGCMPVQVLIRTEKFNVTLGSEKICFTDGHSFNLTYNVPLSKFMQEKRFELVFVTPISQQWRLCSTKQRIGKDNYVQYENNNNDDIISHKKLIAKSVFDIDIPQFGYFERQMEFRTINRSNQNACSIISGNNVQFVLYKINIFRDCN